MVRISILCLVLLVIMVSVSFADNNEVIRSTDLKKVKGGGTDRSISKVNDDDHDDDNDADHDHDNNNNSDADHDHDNDDDDHDHDNDDDHDHDDDHDNDNDDDGEDDNDNDDDGEDDNDDDDDDDGDEDDGDDCDDGDDGDDGDDEKKTLKVHELKKGNLTVKFSNRGASIMSLLFPDKSGKMEDIVLGYDYINDTVFCGATVARVGNRREKTVANDAKNTINGGTKGSGDVIWTVIKKHNHNAKKPYIVFTYTSPDGDQGFPGKLDVTVTYKLVGENKLKMVMEAKAKEKATPVNLVHQSYWNLGGHDNEDILSEEIQILGSGYAHLDDTLTPTGKILAVKGTPYDYRQLRPIKDNIKTAGYGVNYCLDGVANKMRKVMELVDKKSKVKMELSTDQSGLKFYTGGRLKIIKGKNGSVHKAYSGLCLESHAINYKYLPSQIVEPGKNYKHTMLFKFSIVP